MIFTKTLSVGKVVDYSMLSAAEVEKRKINEADTYQGGNHAFDDLTDIQNDEFIVRFQLFSLQRLLKRENYSTFIDSSAKFAIEFECILRWTWLWYSPG